MTAKKKTNKSDAKKVSIQRSSSAEYLTFIAASGQGGVEAVYADENVWLTQKMMAVLYNVDVLTIKGFAQKHMRKANSSNTASCRTVCLRAILTGLYTMRNPIWPPMMVPLNSHTH